MMRVPLATLLLLSACGGDEPLAKNAEVGWTLNYRDWTKADCADGGGPSCTNDELRTCDNQPAIGTNVPYPSVAAVSVSFADPNSQVPPFGESFDCTRGTGGRRIDVRGLVKQTFTLTVEAKSAAGLVLYRFPTGDEDPSVDLSSLQVLDLELRAATGELRFTPTFAGSFDCPTGVLEFRWTLLADGTSDIVAIGTTPACDGLRIASELIIRGIPYDYDRTPAGTPTPYDLKVEALDGGGTVQHCSVSDRDIFPGDNNFRSNQSLSPGACP